MLDARARVAVAPIGSASYHDLRHLDVLNRILVYPTRNLVNLDYTFFLYHHGRIRERRPRNVQRPLAFPSHSMGRPARGPTIPAPSARRTLEIDQRRRTNDQRISVKPRTVRLRPRTRAVPRPVELACKAAVECVFRFVRGNLVAITCELLPY